MLRLDSCMGTWITVILWSWVYTVHNCTASNALCMLADWERKVFKSRRKLSNKRVGSRTMSCNVIGPATEKVRRPNIERRWWGMLTADGSWQTAGAADTRTQQAEVKRALTNSSDINKLPTTWMCILMTALPISVAPKNVPNGTRKCPHVMPARSNRGLGIWNRPPARRSFSKASITSHTKHYCCCFLWSLYVIGQTIIFLPCGFYLSFFFFSPNVSGWRLDVYRTSTHGVALVRI